MVAVQALAALFLTLVTASSASPIEHTNQPLKRCTATISSYSDVATAVSSKCSTVVVNSFIVPAGKPFDLSGLATGTTVNVAGDVTFASAQWDGPLFIIDGESITFQGNGHTFDGQGQGVWDTKGSNGGTTKPQFLKLKHSGTFSNLKVINSPRQVFSIGSNSALLTVDSVQIDNSAGDKLSGGKPLAHNTDGFDVSASNVIIKNCRIINQDDAIAINSGSNIQFLNNYCSGGHGISIGSIQTGKTVSGVTISGNTVVNSDNGLRIKTVSGATSASVSDVTYTGNTVTGAAKYGVVIQQDYLNGGPTGTPTNGVSISNINFSGTNTVSVSSGAKEVYVLCGSGSCKGTWNWAGLKVNGGSKGNITGNPPIKNFSL
ncbi:hypothetical protein NliqN6_6725 [Naganishia liquefaciens]|uniref:endo-polygalacturonase n=1 Tax=Naganishia liquefaciens TaxID=104408 RepID=A0A8H3YIE8_9TREE|nr:hypothetical protein NliqN6_6725 [Naganishia liquefaciens]